MTRPPARPILHRAHRCLSPVGSRVDRRPSGVVVRCRRRWRSPCWRCWRSIGLGVDGSRAAQGMATADAIAEEAARAGGQALDSAALHRGTVAVDRAAAQTAARAYLTAADTADPTRTITATVTLVAPDRLRVQVTATQPTVLLGLIGIDTLTVHGSADAVLVPTAGATP